ncbi:MAG: autotransporter-associated beta strand repeat-containing protein [Phycisphaeraceae bacterium]
MASQQPTPCPPAATAPSTFNQPFTPNPTISLNGNRAFSRFNLTAPQPYTLNNGTISLRNSSGQGIFVAGSGVTHTINADISHHFGFNMPIDVAGGTSFIVNGRINGNRFGTERSLSKNGAGGLTIRSNNNTMSTVFLNDGVVSITENGALGSGEIIFNGGALRIEGTTLNAMSDLSNTFDYRDNDGALWIKDPGNTFNVDVPITDPAGTDQFTLTKLGAGTLRMTVPNSYAGGTIIKEGTVVVSADNQFGSNGSVHLDGGSLRFEAGVTLQRPLWINAQQGEIATQGFDVVINAPVDGPGTLIKRDAGTLTLALQGFPNTASVDVEAGTLILDKFTGVDAVAGTLTIRPGTEVIAMASEQIADNANIRIVGSGPSGQLTLTAGTETVDQLFLSDATYSHTQGELILLGNNDTPLLMQQESALFVSGGSVTANTNAQTFNVDRLLNVSGSGVFNWTGTGTLSLANDQSILDLVNGGTLNTPDTTDATINARGSTKILSGAQLNTQSLTHLEGSIRIEGAGSHLDMASGTANSVFRINSTTGSIEIKDQSLASFETITTNVPSNTNITIAIESAGVMTIADGLYAHPGTPAFSTANVQLNITVDGPGSRLEASTAEVILGSAGGQRTQMTISNGATASINFLDISTGSEVVINDSHLVAGTVIRDGLIEMSSGTLDVASLDGTIGIDGGTATVNFSTAGSYVRMFGGTFTPGGVGFVGASRLGGFDPEGGNLTIELGGLTPGIDHDWLDIGDFNPIDNSDLIILPLADYSPEAGDSFEIITWFNDFGVTTDRFNLDTSAFPLHTFDIQYNANDITLLVTDVRLLGDIDLDGDIDANDINVLA